MNNSSFNRIQIGNAVIITGTTEFNRRVRFEHVGFNQWRIINEYTGQVIVPLMTTAEARQNINARLLSGRIVVGITTPKKSERPRPKKNNNNKK